jgi:hypothetical protein
MRRQILIRHRDDILRRGIVAVSITAGAGLWAFTMIRMAGIELG